MIRANVLVDGLLAGELQELVRGKQYRFVYLEKYNGPSVSLEMPTNQSIYVFDRLPKNKKVATEDFSQLLGFSRETKYESSMEKVIAVLEKHCAFPKVEKLKLFRLSVFNFLIGNEDMHLKNFTLIRREDKVELSPAYDLLNTTIVLTAKEAIALPLKGKKIDSHEKICSIILAVKN